MKQIALRSKGRVAIDKTPTRHTRLRLRNGRLVTVLASRYLLGYKGAVRWLLQPVQAERRHIALVLRLNGQNDAVKDMFVLPPIGISTGVQVEEHDLRLLRGVQLLDLANFCDAVGQVASQGKRRSRQGDLKTVRSRSR